MSDNNNNNNNKEKAPRKVRSAEQKQASKAAHEQKLSGAKDISFRAESFGDIQKAIRNAVAVNKLDTDERLSGLLRSLNAMTLKISNLEKTNKFLTNGQAGRLMSTAGQLSMIAGKPRPCSTPEQVFDAINSFINSKNALPKMFEDPDGNSVIMKSNASLIYTFKAAPYVGYAVGDEIYWVFLRRAAFRGVTILSVNPQTRAYRVIAYVSSQRNPNESGTLAAQIGTLFSVRVPTVAAGTGITVTSNVWAEQMIGTSQGPLLIPAGKFNLYNPRNTSQLLGTSTAVYVDFPIMATDETILTPSPADNINGSIWPISNGSLSTDGLPASARSNITRNLNISAGNATANLAVVGGFSPVVFGAFPTPFNIGAASTVLWRLSGHQMFRRYLFSGAFTIDAMLTVINVGTGTVGYTMSVVFDNGDGTDTTLNVNLGTTLITLGSQVVSLRYCTNNTIISQYAGFLIRDIFITATGSAVGGSLRIGPTDNCQINVQFHDVDQAQQLVFGCLTGINDGYRAEFMLHSQAQNFRDSISKEGAALSDDFSHACDVGMFRDVLLQTALEGDSMNPDSTVMETGSFLKKVKKFANKVAKVAGPALLNAIPGAPGVVARGVADFATASCDILPSPVPALPSTHYESTVERTEAHVRDLAVAMGKTILLFLLRQGVPTLIAMMMLQIGEQVRSFNATALNRVMITPDLEADFALKRLIEHERFHRREVRANFAGVLAGLKEFHGSIWTSLVNPCFHPSQMRNSTSTRCITQRSIRVSELDQQLVYDVLNEQGRVTGAGSFKYMIGADVERHPVVLRAEPCPEGAEAKIRTLPSTFLASLLDKHMRDNVSEVPSMSLKEFAGHDQWHIFPNAYTTDEQLLSYMQVLLTSDVKHFFTVMQHRDGLRAHVTLSFLGAVLCETGFSEVSCNLAVNDALIRMLKGLTKPFSTSAFGQLPHIQKYRAPVQPSQEALDAVIPGFYAPGVSQIDEDSAAYEIYSMTAAPALAAECFLKASLPAVGSSVVTQGDSYTLAATLAALSKAGFPVKKGCYTGEVRRVSIGPSEFSFSVIPVAGMKMKLAACRAQDIMLTGFFPKICIVDNVVVPEFCPADFFDDPTGVSIMSSPAPEGFEGPMLTFSYQAE